MLSTASPRLFHLLLIALLALGAVAPAHADSNDNNGANNHNCTIQTSCTIDGPDTIYVGDGDSYTCTVTPATDGKFTWTVEGPLEIQTNAGTGDCPTWGSTLTTECSEGATDTETIRGTASGKGKIKVHWEPCSDTTFCPCDCDKDVTVLDRLKPPPKIAVGAKYRRVDVHGVPMPDPSPTGEGEQDRLPNMAYTDMYSLSPSYMVSDVAVPVEGGELTLEFRRTASIRSRNYNIDLTHRGIVYPTQDICGLGWDTNIGSHVAVSLDLDPTTNVLYTAAHVTDEVGNLYDYQDTALGNGAYTPDVTHSFNNLALRCSLAKGGGTVPSTDGRNVPAKLTLTKVHGTALHFSYLRTFFPPAQKAAQCQVTVLHHEDYYRLDDITDRNGNQIVFTYQAAQPGFDIFTPDQPGSNGGPDKDLLPATIFEAAHPERQISFSFINVGYEGQGLDTGWRVASVAGPLNPPTTYQYYPKQSPSNPLDPNSVTDKNQRLLASVTKPAVFDADSNTTISPKVSFTYERMDLPDVTIDPLAQPDSIPGINRFIGPATISDARFNANSTKGNTTTFAYRAEMFPSAVYAVLGTSVWQLKMRVASESTADGTAIFDTDARSGLFVQTHVQDVVGTVTTFAFTSQMINAPNSAGKMIAISEFDRTSHLANGDKVAKFGFSVDADNNLLAVTDLSGNHIAFSYQTSSGVPTGGDSDPFNRPAHGGAYDSYLSPSSYQLFDKPASRTVDPGGLSLTTQYRYGAFNKEIQTTDAEGKVTNEILDGRGNRTAIQEPLGKTTQFFYDGDGFINQTIDPMGRVTSSTRVFTPGNLSGYLTTTTTVIGDQAHGENLGIQTVTVADILGNQRSVKDPNLNVTTMLYDALNRRLSTTRPAVENPANPGGSPITSMSQTAYDLNGNVLLATDDQGNVTRNTYDRMNRQIETRRRMTNPGADDAANDMITATQYTPVGLPSATIDPRGLTTSMEYDGLLRLTRKLKPTVTLPGGATARYTERYFYGTIPGSGSQADQPDAGTNPGSGAFTHWSGWQPTRVLTDHSRADGTIYAVATDTVYDKIYRPILVVQRGDDAAGLSSTTAARAASGALPAEPAVSKTYNKVHKLVTQTTTNENFAGTAANQVTTNVYDDLWRVTEAHVALSSGVEAVTKTAYDLSDLVLNVTDAESHVTTNAYDGAKRLTSTTQAQVTVVDPAGFNPNGLRNPVTTTAYDQASNKVLVTDANGTKTQMQYDARNRLIRSIIDVDGNGTFDATFHPTQAGTDIVTETHYNLVDKPIHTVDSRGNATDTAYDRAYRVVTVMQPAVVDAEPGHNNATVRPVIATTYDLDGNVVTMTDARGVATVNTYDELNRLRTTTQASGTADAVVTESQYDATNDVIALSLYNSAGNGGTQTTRYVFDAFNRKLSETLPLANDNLARVTAFAYYRNGTVRTTTDAKGQVSEMEYDLASRLVISRHKRADASLEETRTYAYNKVNKPTSVSDVSGTSTYGYDALYRVVSEGRTTTGQLAYTVASAYDAAGNRTQCIYPATNRTLVSVFDRVGRLLQVRDGTQTTTYAYDANGNRLLCTDPNTQSTAYTYDALSRDLTSRTTRASGSAVIASYVFAFDLVGNRRHVDETLETEADRHVDYVYDAQYRLTSEAWTGFSQAITYDPAGNRTKLTRVVGATTTVTTYVCDVLNRLVSSSQTVNGGAAQATSYTYDLDGNQITQVIPGQPTLSMVYDTHNRLIGGSAMGAATGTAAASYDYRTRRQTKSAMVGGATTFTFFRYDQGDSFQELKPVSPSPTQATALQVELIRGSGMGGGIGSILYTDRTAAAGPVETFAYNPSVGHVVALTNPIAATTETNRYDAFGNIVQTTGASLNNRLANTKERDISIPGVFTLDDHGMRYYNPITARYISRDPTGYGDGPNVYAYVHNNPINRIDPLGLEDDDEKPAKRINDTAKNLLTAQANVAALQNQHLQLQDQFVSGKIKKEEFETKSRGIMESMRYWSGAEHDFATSLSIQLENAGYEGLGKALQKALGEGDIRKVLVFTAENKVTLSQLAREEEEKALDEAAQNCVPIGGSGGPIKVVAKEITEEMALKALIVKGVGPLAIPKVIDKKLANLVADLYKGAKGANPIGVGSTADAVRSELLTGIATGGKMHMQKAQEYIKALTNWSAKNAAASASDKLVARSLLEDLNAAVSGH